MGGQRRWFVIGLTVVACLIALHDCRVVAHDSCCDMTTYTEMGLDFARKGLFGSSHELMSLRTYGYPFFVDLLSRLTDQSPEQVQIAVFVAQLVLFFAVAWVLASIFARALGASQLAIYAVIILDPVLLAATPAVLSDLLGALLVSVSFALLFQESGRRPLIVFLSFLLASAGAMVRPASVVFLPIMLVLWLASTRWLRAVPWRAWPLAFVGAVVPLVPQVINNWRLFGRISPLIAQPLYAEQTIWGMKLLKYGTAIPTAPLNYINPWYDGSSPTFFAWLATHPLRALGTAGMHLFALFDQDFAFTYVHDRHPWYRWPLCAAGFAYVFVGVAMICVIALRAWRARELERASFCALAVIAAIAGYVLLYLPTAVESRFSQPIYLMLAPFVVSGVAAYWRSRRSWAWPVGLAAFLAACLPLSAWLAHRAVTMPLR